MEEKTTKSQPARSVEIVAAVTIGILTIVIFVAHALTQSSTTTAKETVLFNLLEFLLTVAFTWFTTIAISRHQFEQSLKRFATGAFRRISDIERLVARLQSEVRRMITESSDEQNHDLYVVEAIVTDTCQVVRSSIADWADVIGDELIAIEKIKRLEQEKVDLDDNATTPSARSHSDTLNEINKQIAELKATLPARLQVAPALSETLRKDLHAARWVARQHKIDNGLKLTVVSGDGYPHDRDHKTLTVGEELRTLRDEKDVVNVADKNGAILGRLMNLSPLSYTEFMKALEVCYGTHSISLQFLEQHGAEMRDGELHVWFTTKVTQEPKADLRWRPKKPVLK